MSGGITVIVPVAHDLDTVDGSVICGTGTMKACDHALALMKRFPRSQLFVSAREAPRFGNVVMGEVMRAYLLKKLPDAITSFLKAKYFNTLGEVLATYEHVHELRQMYGPQAVERVVFAVKDWHARRVDKLARAVFTHYRLDVPVCIKVHHVPEAPPTRRERLLEPIKTACFLWFFHHVHLKKQAEA
ncbi:MAG TPA: hypothetical protein VEA36_02950 [Candidatus Paceibacterota bacterium]|nr:hypothetical protein [Candidatus Paceibacterota bacterium]